MTSTTVGLPDRYRPLDQVGPDEPTATGVIRCWRARDRVLNRDVAIRVHTPAGPPAHDWIARALTAGGLATPALAMVYDASEGTPDPTVPGGAAYVVNEWIEGETLAERLTRGPLPEREIRTVLRRLAEGVAEAHRVGLAVGGLTLESVVLRPNGLVGLRAVPAATGTVEGDVAALGELLEACLTGRPADGAARPMTGPPDLLALVRRARSSEPGQGLSSVAAMAALLAERPRSAASPPAVTAAAPADGERPDSGWLRRLRERRPDATPAVDDDDAPPVRLEPHTLPPVPPVPTAVRPPGAPSPPQRPAEGTPRVRQGDTVDVSTVPPTGVYAGWNGRGQPGRSTFLDDRYDDESLGVLNEPYDDGPARPAEEHDLAPPTTARRRLAVLGPVLLALAVVIGLAWWLGSNVLSVAGSVDTVEGSTPSVTAPGAEPAEPAEEDAPAGGPAEITAADVYDPEGDGEPENDPDVPLSFDGDPGTAWSTLDYQGSPEFGNLKSGVGVLYDLGREQSLTGVTLATTTPGAVVEVRTGSSPDGALEDYAVATDATLDESSELAFDEPVEAQFVLVWFTRLVEGEGGFSADLAEITVTTGG